MCDTVICCLTSNASNFYVSLYINLNRATGATQNLYTKSNVFIFDMANESRTKLDPCVLNVTIDWLINLTPKSDQHQFSPNNINA